MDPLKKELGERLVTYIEAHSLWGLVLQLAVLVAISMGAGALIFWLWKRHKIKAETRKILQETEKIAVEVSEKKLALLKQVYEYRDKFTASSDTVSIALRGIFDALRARDAAATNQEREEAIRLFFAEMVDSFSKYCEVCMTCLSTPEKRVFAREEILPFLQTSDRFLTGVNYPAVLQFVAREPATADEMTWSRILRFARSSVALWRVPTRRALGKLEEKLAMHRDLSINEKG